MFTYRNLMTGRVVDRPAADPWLEASSGWELVEDEPKELEAKTKAEPKDDDERTK